MTYSEMKRMDKKREDMTPEELEECRKRGKRARRRGRTGESEIAHILQEYGFEGERGVQYCGRRGNADVVGLDHVHLEVKRVEQLQLRAAIKQSQDERRKGEIPMVCHRRNGEPWYCTMDMRVFMDMWAALSEEARMLVAEKYESRETSKCKKKNAQYAEKSGKKDS